MTDVGHGRGVIAALLAFLDALSALPAAALNLVRAACGAPKTNLVEGHIMYVVKDTQPDVDFEIKFTAIDAKGVTVPNDSLVVSALVSDNPGAVAVTMDATNPRKGTVSFNDPNKDGTPAIANLNCTVALADGTVVGSIGDQFTVTPGDPAAIAGGTIAFAGLTTAP